MVKIILLSLFVCSFWTLDFFFRQEIITKLNDNHPMPITIADGIDYVRSNLLVCIVIPLITGLLYKRDAERQSELLYIMAFICFLSAIIMAIMFSGNIVLYQHPLLAERSFENPGVIPLFNVLGSVLSFVITSVTILLGAEIRARDQQKRYKKCIFEFEQ